MTSRAGQARASIIGMFATVEGDVEALNEAFDAVAEEVRDDIRARVEALRWADEPDDYDQLDGFHKHNDAIDDALKAISSSSATETAWMVRMPTNITSGDVLITEDGRWVRRDGEWVRDDSDLDRPSSATETQDGERWLDVGTPRARRAWPRTPTPDDRDREVERIAAVLDDTVLVSDTKRVAAKLYDAGLRASGGD